MRAALQDAHLNYSEVQQMYARYVYGHSCAGQRAVYAVGMSDVSVINVNNNCSTALFLARQAVAAGAGAVKCALALRYFGWTARCASRRRS